jgi:hypothetical protein
MHNIVRLRALAPAKGFAIEPSMFRGRFRLVQLDIGHRIRSGETSLPTFTVHQACVVPALGRGPRQGLAGPPLQDR